MISSFAGMKISQEAGRGYSGFEEKETDRIQNAVADYVLAHPSLQGSPMSMALKARVERGDIPRTREAFTQFQQDFIDNCLSQVQSLKNPRPWTWLIDEIRDTRPYQWDAIEKISQFAHLSLALTDPVSFVAHVKRLIQTGRTRYLKEPNLAPMLKNPLLLEALVNDAITNSDEILKGFVTEFFIDHHLHSYPVYEDPGITWLSLQKGKDSPLLRFFQKVGVLDARRHVKCDVLSLKEPIKILQQLLKREERWMDTSFDYEDLENLDTQMKELALKKFNALLTIYLKSKPEDPYLVTLDQIQKRDYSDLNQKVSALQNAVETSSAYPQLLEVLTEIFSKNSNNIDKAAEAIEKRECRFGNNRIRNGVLWKIKDSWNLERMRIPPENFLSHISSICTTFFRSCGIDMSRCSIATQFIEFSVLSELFATGLIEDVQEFSLDPLYEDLIRLAFADKNVSALFEIADMIFYQKYLLWVKNLPVENRVFQQKALKNDQKSTQDQLTCKEKLERALFYVGTAAGYLSQAQTLQAIGILSGASTKIYSLQKAHVELKLATSAHKLLQKNLETNSGAKKEIERIHQYRDLELKLLGNDTPFRLFLQEIGVLGKQNKVMAHYFLDELSLYKIEFVKRMEQRFGRSFESNDYDINEINNMVHSLILEHFEKEILGGLSVELQRSAKRILDDLEISPAEKISELQRRCNSPQVTEALRLSFPKKEAPQETLNLVRASPFYESFLRTMHVEQSPEMSLEDHAIERASLLHFFTQPLIRTGQSFGLDMSGVSEKVDFYDLEGLERILEAVLFVQYQNTLKSLPKSEPGIGDLLKLGSKISLSECRLKIQQSTSLTESRKRELLALLSLESHVQKLKDNVEDAFNWVRDKVMLYQLPIDENELSSARTGYQKWSTVKKGLNLLFFHVKARAEKAGLHPDYLLFLEGSLLVHQRHFSNLFLKEMEENMLDWDKYL